MGLNEEKITICTRKDFNVSYFVGPGKGGQKKQKCHTGVHIIHKESGAFGRNSETRSQEKNKELAFEKLRNHPKFKIWLNKKLFELREKETMEENILKSLTPENLKYEIQDKNGKWIEVKEEYFRDK